MKKSPIPAEKPLFPMRINKYLAYKGYSTRRGADELIEKKQVLINGTVAKLGDKVLETDQIDVQVRGAQKKLLYFAYNKPKGIVTHSSQKHDKEIKDVIKLPGVYPIGRLDKESTGLLILTNDGRITERLLGPKYEHEKEYFVTTKEKLRTSFKNKMEAGVRIEDEHTLPCTVHIVRDNAFRIILTEGKKHQIRRMCSALFQEVDELKRMRIMNIHLGKLGIGQFRAIDGEELQEFLRSLGL